MNGMEALQQIVTACARHRVQATQVVSGTVSEVERKIADLVTAEANKIGEGTVLDLFKEIQQIQQQGKK